MRCLFCGKELALLKRWTGGGEFCSEAHRQQYQEEYNQLALTRLLQAKPQHKGEEEKPEEPEKPASTKRHPDPAPVASSPTPSPVFRETPVRETPAYRPVAVATPPEEPVYVAQAPPEPEATEPDPAEPGGFIVEMPVAALVETPFMVKPEIDLEYRGTTELPAPREVPELTAGLPPAKTVPISALTGSVRDFPTKLQDRGVEIREFVRPKPVIDGGSWNPRETGLETSGEPIPVTPDSLLSIQAPAQASTLWSENERELRAFALELGALARVPFHTTGVKDDEDGMPPPRDPESIEPLPEPEPEPDPEILQAPAVEQPERIAAPDPALITKPLPLTLHGLAAPKGKPVQIFAAAAAGSSVDVRIPRSTALPLRPLMMVGPAEKAAEKPAPEKVEKKPQAVVKSEPKVEAKPEIKPEPKKAAPPQPVKVEAKTEARPVPTKVRKPEVRVVNPEKKEPATPAAAVQTKPPAKPATTPAAKPVEKKPGPAAAQTAKPKDAPAPKPAAPAIAPPVEPTVDLGLPSLSLDSNSGNAFTRLPIAAKVGLAVGLLAIIGGIFFFMRSGSASGKGNPVEVGKPLAITDTGWITDWGNDPTASRPRQILMLRPSLDLTDYRVDFAARIETKALGWVFRAKDAKNYYVTKLEVLKAGANPNVSLVHFAVVNGQESQRMDQPLPMPVRQDTLYRIHFEAIGNHFTTTVLDHKVDDWSDDRLTSGGIGMYNERGESAALSGGVSVVPLAARK